MVGCSAFSKKNMKTKILLPFTIVSFLFIFLILYVGLNRSNIYIPETVTNEKIPTFKVKVFNSEKELIKILEEKKFLNVKPIKLNSNFKIDKIHYQTFELF